MTAKPTDSPPNRKTYFVCAWQAYIEGKEEGWYTDPKGTAWAVRSFLKAEVPAWDEVNADESEANLIVVIPRARDHRLSVDDLCVYATGLGGAVKQVLYVHCAGAVAFTEGRVNDWLFFASRASCPTEKIKDWLKEEPESLRIYEPIDPFPLSFAHQKLMKVLADRARKPIAASTAISLKRFNDPLSDKEQEIVDHIDARLRILQRFVGQQCGINSLNLSRSGTRLILESHSKGDQRQQPSRAKFFFGVCRLCKDYNRIEHDINARGADSKDAYSEDIVCDEARRRFLDTCVDLRNAISAYCRCATRAPDPRKRILLIDDNPSRVGFDTKLREAVTKFLPSFTLSIWNPDEKLTEKGEPLRRGYLEHYTSMGAGESEAFLKRRLVTHDGAEKEESLEDVLRDTQVIFVDILFTDARGNDHEAGYGIMRGFQRLFRDVRKHMNRDPENPWLVPEVLAISRASEIAKVQTVYRSGAAGYVLKRRPLSLPGAVANTFHAALDPVATAHRNFRLLYNLPHRTMGLLRNTAVPQVSFHQPFPEEGSPERDEKEKEVQHALPMAKLLAVLPKADLHVHPGTCMTPEFLVVASLVMLARHRLHVDKNKGKDPKQFADAVQWLAGAFGGAKITLEQELAVRDPRKKSDCDIDFSGDADRVACVAWDIREFLVAEINAGELNRGVVSSNKEIEARYVKFRSILHESLALPDHQSKDQIIRILRKRSDFALFFFALQHCNRGGAKTIDDTDDLMRLYLLWLAGYEYKSDDHESMKPYGEVKVTIGKSHSIDIHRWFWKGDFDTTSLRDWRTWSRLHCLFYRKGTSGIGGFRGRNWTIDPENSAMPSVEIRLGSKRGWGDLLADCPDSKDHPIAYLLASGTRSSNLREYLEGCEYTGAEHMKHPFLMHLYAQQTVCEFIRHGVFYAELRTSLSGYENAKLNITFSDACACFCTAMGQAQEMARQKHRESQDVKGWLWRNCFDLDRLFNPLKDELATYRFPCKTSVVLTGKRHKSSRLLVREAGAGAVLHARPLNPAASAGEFSKRAVRECRVVGFDLAGQEDEHHPQEFRAEYEQISRMHIPVTIHAGENAPVGFVESAILDLMARRLGHGLALADDRLLMERARDDGICIELCPVSNFQTNAVYPKGKSGQGREYPLHKFFKMGLNVTLNTDNPVVSHTNMVKECFQASYALGGTGLSVWELLRILRTGFTQSFLTQPERRALLELADQIVFDLFSRPEILDMLGVAAFQRPPSQALGPPP